MGSSAGKNSNSDKKLGKESDSSLQEIQKNKMFPQNSDSQWDDVHGNFILPHNKLELKKQCMETQQQVDDTLKRLMELNIIPSDINSKSKQNLRSRYPQKHNSYQQQPIKGIQSDRILKKKNNQDNVNVIKFFGPDQIIRRNQSKPSIQGFTYVQNSPQNEKENICQNYKYSNQLKQVRMNVNFSPSRNNFQEKGFLPQINQNKNPIQRSESLSQIIKT